MTTNTTNQPEQAVADFKKLSVDDQLAWLWFAYTKMGSSITPAAPGAAGEDIAEGLYNQVKELSHEEQLQVQRDIASKADTIISREYGSLSANTKLFFWYRLAQGMESNVIIPMPPGYEMSDSVKELLERFEGLDFNEQITIFRDSVIDMGAEAKGGSEI